MTPTDNLEAGAGDLVDRLLTDAAYLGIKNGSLPVIGRDCAEAAAQLAAVTAERDAALDKDWVSFPSYEAALKAGRDFRDRATTAEAENARLREALERATADLRDIASNCTGRVDAGGLPALVAKCGLEALAALSQEAPK